MTSIVTTAYRPKRPPPKRKAIALAGPVVVTRANKRREPPPANDDAPAKPAPAAAKPAIVTTTSRKRAKLLRASVQNGKIAELDDDPEATARCAGSCCACAERCEGYRLRAPATHHHAEASEAHHQQRSDVGSGHTLRLQC